MVNLTLFHICVIVHMPIPSGVEKFANIENKKCLISIIWVIAIAAFENSSALESGNIIDSAMFNVPGPNSYQLNGNDY